MWYAPDGSWGWMIGGGVMMILVWGSLIFLAILLARTLVDGGGRSAPSRTDRSALEILEARYARGEIDREQYQMMRADLLSSG